MCWSSTFSVSVVGLNVLQSPVSISNSSIISLFSCLSALGFRAARKWGVNPVDWSWCEWQLCNPTNSHLKCTTQMDSSVCFKMFCLGITCEAGIVQKKKSLCFLWPLFRKAAGWTAAKASACRYQCVCCCADAGVEATAALCGEGYGSDRLRCVRTQTSKLSGQLPASRKLWQGMSTEEKKRRKGCFFSTSELWK